MLPGKHQVASGYFYSFSWLEARLLTGPSLPGRIYPSCEIQQGKHALSSICEGVLMGSIKRACHSLEHCFPGDHFCPDSAGFSQDPKDLVLELSLGSLVWVSLFHVVLIGMIVSAVVWLFCIIYGLVNCFILVLTASCQESSTWDVIRICNKNSLDVIW